MPNRIIGVDTFLISKTSQPDEKEIEENSTNKARQSSVILIYEANVAGFTRNVTVTWTKTLINYSLTITIENLSNENHYNAKIDLKSWQFWGKKGLKSIQVDGKRVEIYWDFRHAKFSSNPVPVSNYYVAMVYEEEVVLTLGDSNKEAYKRTKKRPALEEPILLCKKENVHGKKIFCTKANLHEDKKEHEIVIEMSSGGPDDPELWISIDGLEVIHVINLHWKFRGNEMVNLKNNLMVKIFWDVHDWLFNNSTNSSSSSSCTRGLFIFKPIDEAEATLDTNINGDIDLRYDSHSQTDYFHAIYAWKLD